MADRQLRSARQVVAIGTGHPRPANGDDMAQVLALLNAPTTIALDAALMPQQGILVSHGRWNAAPSTASISLANHGLDQSTRSDLPWSGNETLRLCEIVQRCEQAGMSRQHDQDEIVASAATLLPTHSRHSILRQLASGAFERRYCRHIQREHNVRVRRKNTLEIAQVPASSSAVKRKETLASYRHERAALDRILKSFYANHEALRGSLVTLTQPVDIVAPQQIVRHVSQTQASSLTAPTERRYPLRYAERTTMHMPTSKKNDVDRSSSESDSDVQSDTISSLATSHASQAMNSQFGSRACHEYSRLMSELDVILGLNEQNRTTVAERSSIESRLQQLDEILGLVHASEGEHSNEWNARLASGDGAPRASVQNIEARREQLDLILGLSDHSDDTLNPCADSHDVFSLGTSSQPNEFHLQRMARLDEILALTWSEQALPLPLAETASPDRSIRCATLDTVLGLSKTPSE